MAMVGNSPQTSRTPPISNADGKAGALALDDLGVLTFDGPDSASFLQGYLTIDMDALGGEPAFTAMCNIKGRAVLTGYAWREGERVTLVLQQSLCGLTLGFLSPYLAFSKTQASDATDDYAIIGAMGLNLAPPALNLNAGRQLLVLDEDGFDKAHDLLTKGPSLSTNEWRNVTLARREVWLEAATSGSFLPQMLALDELGAVSFNKGCYLGQEVVARAQHRGDVKRRLEPFEWKVSEPHIGAEIRRADGHAGGVVVATAPQSANEGAALVVLNRGATGPFTIKNSNCELRQISAE